MEEVTPKEYLRQLRVFSIKIQQKKEELESLKAAAENVTASIDNERVQTSPKDRMPEDISRIVDLENEIREDTHRLIFMKDKIINEIHKLNNPVYIEILYKRYVEYKSLEEISVELSYSYIHVKRLHGYALQAFRKQFQNYFARSRRK